jgi:nucleoside-diphosphate-sugar epimerase
VTRALVTGGAGFIGSSIARELLANDWEVRILDNFLTGFEDAVPQDAELVRGDIRDLDTCRAACADIDVVFHQAAFRSVPKSVDDPRLSNDCNITGSLNLLMAAGDAGVKRLVYASSSSAYGDISGTINQEDLPTNPRSPYAVSKLAAEQYCRLWSDLKGLSTVSLRYFNVFGPGQHPDSKYSAVFPGFVSALVEGRAPEVHWDGEQSRDFTYIDDVVRANILGAQADDRVSGMVFNIGGGEPKSINDVLRAVADAVGTWIEPQHSPKRQGDIRSTEADVSRAAEYLGWKPEADWVESVAATVSWFQQKRAK